MALKLAASFLLLVPIALSGKTGAQTNSQTCARIQTLLQDPTAAQAHSGLSVTTLAGVPLCLINQAQLFRPASNAKLFTVAAAFAAALAYPEPVLTTRVAGTLDPATGTVTGDLTLIGAGDANLDSNDLPYQPHRPAHPANLPDLEDLAAQLQTAGVQHIAGDIVGNDTLIPYEPYPQGWSADDLTWGYGAPVSALTLADNQLRLTVTPGLLDRSALVALEQYNTAYYQVLNETHTTTAKLATGIQVERLPGSRTVRVFGTIALSSPPDAEEIAIDEPALFAATALHTILLSRGITVQGHARATHHEQDDPTPFTVRLKQPLEREQLLFHGSYVTACMEPLYGQILATHHAPPRAQDLAFTLKASQNLHAELLFHGLALSTLCRNADTAQSARLVRAFALQAGVLPTDFFLYDGSGLSTQDLATPRAFTTLLAYAAKQPWFVGFKAALPVGGVDGTLAARFTTTLKGKVFAKTGTLGESRALSGYLTAVSGQTLAFSILTDTHPPGTTADRTLTDKIVELLANAY